MSENLDVICWTRKERYVVYCMYKRIHYQSGSLELCCKKIVERFLDQIDSPEDKKWNKEVMRFIKGVESKKLCRIYFDSESENFNDPEFRKQLSENLENEIRRQEICIAEN